MLDREQYYYWLSNLPGIGIKKATSLLRFYKSPENIYRGTSDELMHVPLLSDKDIESILSNKNKELSIKSYDILKKKGIYFVSRDNPQYPSKLKNIFDSPIGLYVRGELPDEEKKSIAIVGARNCSNYGKEIANYLSRELSNHGIQVISGLARGIDTYAHIGAIGGIGRTYGVLGCGIDICYPADNIELYMKLQQCGGIISEYGIGVQAKPGLFPMRNRLISGMSDGILVVEAKEKSGSLITVDYGLEQGKDIYSIPGRVTDRSSSGCNNLIKMGAKLVTNVEDILEDMVANYKNICLDNGCNNSLYFKKNNKNLEPKEKMVYDMLSLKPKHIDEIILETKLNIDEIMDILINMEFNNYVKSVGTQFYVLSTE